MTAAEVAFSAKALRQLDGIRDFITARASSRIADAYVARIIAQCEGLSLFPERGTRRDDIAAGIRTISYDRRCQILFTVDANLVIIAGIFYGGQDIAAAFDRR